MNPRQRPRLLIVGCGDIGCRVARLLRRRWQILALTSSPSRLIELRLLGVQPLRGDLDRPATLGRLAGLADAVLHLAPPQAEGGTDLRTRALLQALGRRSPPRRVVYVSTTGVYGDAGGDWVAESRPVAPATARAQRRVDAEDQLRTWGRAHAVAVTVLRAPGIYAGDRPGGHPRERLLRGTPVLCSADDVYTNHIHADDLARACAAALHRGPPQRVFNVCDDTVLKSGDYYELAARLLQLPAPPRITRAEAALRLGPMQMSFLSESRRLRNDRLKAELRLRLRYPDAASGLLRG